MLDNNRINQQLMQTIMSLEKCQRQNYEKILDKVDNVNLKVAPTDYLILCHPNWIGNTVLHFLYSSIIREDLFVFMSRKADYTIQNQDDLTVLHLRLRYRDSNRFRYGNVRSVLDDRSINIILSAHVRTKNSTNPCDSNGMTHFHIACMTNHNKSVEFFLDNGIPIDHTINCDSPYFAGFTALHLAIRCCNLEVTKILLKRGASIYLKNNERMSAVHMVLENNLRFANNSLLGYFENSDLPKKHANEEIVKLLLEIIFNSGAKIIDDSSLSSLHIACTITNNLKAEELLTKKDINQSIKTESELWPGYTALHFAALTNYETARLLVKKGADLLAKDANGITPLDLLVERYTAEDIHDILLLNSDYREITCSRNRIKLLDLVSVMRNFNQFEAFLNSFSQTARASVPISSPLWPGFTLMHLIVVFSKSFGNGYARIYEDVNDKYLQMMTKLHHRNSNIITTQDSRGRTPIHLSFRLGKMKNFVKLLLTLLIDSASDLVDDEDLSLLHIACIINNKNLVEKLLSCSRNVNLAYKGKAINDSIETGWTPLHMAVANNSTNVAKTLLKSGADVHSKDVNGVTPIHLIFLLSGKLEIAESLLSVANLRECIIEGVGLSHLHASCFMENNAAAKKLLDSGADVNLTITRDSKVADKSFELAKLVKYLGCTPLEITLWPRHFYKWWTNKGRDWYSNPLNLKLSNLFNLLMKQGADIFVEDSKGIPFVFENLKYFIADLKTDANLQRLVEVKIGLTMVHLACFCEDLDWLKNLLKNGANVNGKLSMNLSTCTGLMPLHIVMENNFPYLNEDMKYEFVKLLLDNGADVTVASNTKKQTPIHTAYHHYIWSGSKIPQLYSCIIEMLKTQKDFSINPTCIKGISHFHIACYVNESSVVKKFLERCEIDINIPIDFLTARGEYGTAGFTPLHMAVYGNKRLNEDIDSASQLETVDLLLKHGADPNFQDSNGNTPLHITKSIEIFERIARDADVNTINVSGETPLGCLLTIYRRKWISVNKIRNLLRCGCHYNAFNIFTGEGYIGSSIKYIPFKELQNFFKTVAINMPHAMRVDEKGRTVIHNIVSIWCEVNISIVEYVTLIEVLAKTGYDIDSQDNLGDTALHLAAEFGNIKAVSALLRAGADTNIQNKEGKTVLTCHIGCTNRDTERCDVFNTLVGHMQKLEICQIDVCRSDSSYIAREYSSFVFNENFYSELEELKNVKIGPSSLTLYNFMSEIDAVANYPMLSQLKKDIINEFFRQDIYGLREKFSEVMGLVNLQYRKAVVRSQLTDNAPASLNFLANFQIPILCSHIILGFLSNSDLKYLIASTEGCENHGQNIRTTSQEKLLPENKKLRMR